MKRCVGIDFGTSNSMIAVCREGGGIDIISSESGKRYLPSVIYFKNENEAVIGDNAKSMQLLESEHTIANIKRYMGTDMLFPLYGREYRAEELASLIFRKLKKSFVDYCGETEADAVVTVPAYFDHYQREAVRSAAENAGFNVLRLLNEPTSAALFYNNIGKNTGDVCMVFDLGGGTLDISLIEMKEDCCKVLYTGGSTEIGGVDFDVAVAEYFIENFRRQHDIDLKSDPIAYQQLLFQAEKAKMELSSLNEVNLVVPYITVTKKGALHFKETITRETFDAITSSLTKGIRNIIENLLESNGLKTDDIAKVLPVGGASRIHSVRRLVSDIFADKVRKDMNPEEAVVSGAAVNAAMISGVIKDKVFYDVTSHNLGVEDDNGNFEVILRKNEVYPVEFSMIFTTPELERKNITVHVLQDMAKSSLNTGNSLEENPEHFASLGRFSVELDENDESEPLIDISFMIDESGIINVKAKDVHTGKETDFTLRLKIENEILDTLEIF
ncbi:molecular chaperone DnaK [Geovibrio sp. ADMFC3]